MQTLNQIQIQAPIGDVYGAAERIVDWPRLLPHYRWVTVFSETGKKRDVEMAAWRSGFPCVWQSDQVLYPKEKKVYYLHTRAFWTKGMQVWWILKARGPRLTEITLTHDMPPTAVPLLGWFRQHIVGELFVMNIAERTLAGLKRHLEQP